MDTRNQILTKDEIMKLQEIYYKIYNERISFDEASQLSGNLLQLFRTLLKIARA